MLVLEEGPDCPCGATGAKSHPNYSPSGITCHRLTGFLIGKKEIILPYGVVGELNKILQEKRQEVHLIIVQ